MITVNFSGSCKKFGLHEQYSNALNGRARKNSDVQAR